MSDNHNEFVVDLGTLKLSDEQRKSINAAIQKAVAGELANLSLTERFIMIPGSPTSRFPGWPHIYGITARLVDEAFLNTLTASPDTGKAGLSGVGQSTTH
jgi:hypothetical protein